MVERQNIARAIDMAMMRTDRHLTASLAELLRVPDQVQGATNRPNQILRRVDDWLAQPQLETVLDQALIVRIQNDAQERFSRGDVDGAIAMLEDLVRRTNTTAVADAKDSFFALGVTLYSLGRLYADAGRPNEALPPFKRAVDLFHRLDEPAAQSNLLQVQLRMATIYRDTGHLDEALRLSSEAIEIARRIGSHREPARCRDSRRRDPAPGAPALGSAPAPRGRDTIDYGEDLEALCFLPSRQGCCVDGHRGSRAGTGDPGGGVGHSTDIGRRRRSARDLERPRPHRTQARPS